MNMMRNLERFRLGKEIKALRTVRIIEWIVKNSVQRHTLNSIFFIFILFSMPVEKIKINQANKEKGNH